MCVCVCKVVYGFSRKKETTYILEIFFIDIPLQMYIEMNFIIIPISHYHSCLLPPPYYNSMIYNGAKRLSNKMSNLQPQIYTPILFLFLSLAQNKSHFSNLSSRGIR